MTGYLVFSLLAGSCKGYFSSSIYPAYLQRTDKVIHLADIPELSRVLQGKSFQARMRSFSFPDSSNPASSETLVAIQVLFKEKSLDDLLILLTSDLRYRDMYRYSDFGLSLGYKFGTLFSEGYGNRILIGCEYVGDNPTLKSKLVAFDPTGKEPPIIQTDPDGVYVTFQGGIPTEDSGGGTWIVQVFNYNTLNFTLLPATYVPPSPSPPATGTNVQVFSSNYPLYVLSQYVKDPVRNLSALLFRQTNASSPFAWIVFNLPVGAPGTGSPLMSTYPFLSNPYDFFQIDGVSRDDQYFYTVDGIVRLSDEGTWSLFRFEIDPITSNLRVSNSDIEGPVIPIEDSLVFHFTVDGKWFYIFDTENLRVTRARTWW